MAESLLSAAACRTQKSRNAGYGIPAVHFAGRYAAEVTTYRD
jgi:hypothetical protein